MELFERNFFRGGKAGLGPYKKTASPSASEILDKIRMEGEAFQLEPPKSARRRGALNLAERASGRPPPAETA